MADSMEIRRQSTTMRRASAQGNCESWSEKRLAVFSINDFEAKAEADVDKTVDVTMQTTDASLTVQMRDASTVKKPPISPKPTWLATRVEDTATRLSHRSTISDVDSGIESTDSRTSQRSVGSDVTSPAILLERCDSIEELPQERVTSEPIDESELQNILLGRAVSVFVDDVTPDELYDVIESPRTPSFDARQSMYENVEFLGVKRGKTSRISTSSS